MENKSVNMQTLTVLLLIASYVVCLDFSKSTQQLFAGNYTALFSGDNGLAINATLKNPKALAIHKKMNMLFIADSGNHRIRAVNLTTNIITTIAGTGTNKIC
jgi:hypothetical protein